MHQGEAARRRGLGPIRSGASGSDGTREDGRAAKRGEAAGHDRTCVAQGGGLGNAEPGTLRQSGTIAVVGAASLVQAFRTQPVEPM